MVSITSWTNPPASGTQGLTAQEHVSLLPTPLAGSSHVCVTASPSPAQEGQGVPCSLSEGAIPALSPSDQRRHSIPPKLEMNS